MAKVTKLTLGIQNGSPNTLYASWAFSKSNLDHYSVQWYYNTGNGIWFDGGSSDVKVKNATYSIPNNATSVKVTVKPVSKTYTKGGKTKSYWSSQSVSKTHTVSAGMPDQLSTPTLELKQLILHVSLDNITDTRCHTVQFELYKGNSKIETRNRTKTTNRVVDSFKLVADSKYRVRCRAINKNGVAGAWSDFSSEVETMPPTPTGVKVSVQTKTSVKVTWTKSNTAERYELQWATDKNYFDKSSSISGVTTEGNVPQQFIEGLSGDEYFVRVRSLKGSEVSGWSSIVSFIIGTEPEAPTTWSSTTTAIVGEDVTLYWVHNTEDGSRMTGAEIELTIAGVVQPPIIYTPTAEESDEEEPEKTYSKTLDLSKYSDGAEILWRIRTKGITGEYGDWSIQRTINLYASPTVELSLGKNILKWWWDPFNFETDDIYNAYSAEVLQTFPYSIVAKSYPKNQTPLSYYLSISADESYISVDDVGRETIINAGDVVYSKIFNVSGSETEEYREKLYEFGYSEDEVNSMFETCHPFITEILASDIILENNIHYTITMTVSMNSGLTAEASSSFEVVWSDDMYEPDASVTVDEETLTAQILPLCVDEYENLIENVVLSVYRREYDGSFTEIASEIPNNGVTEVSDPHPSLDYARYRIIARNEKTSEMGFSDIPGEPVGEPSIVINWDEQWSQFDYEEEAEPEIPPWTGSMVRLPYNIDISETTDKDVSLIEYIGRKNPVTYYGTQRGEGFTANTDIDKSDKELVYALRRLAVYAGDVYVREPSGIGYWAQITVSMSTKHKELVIPVTINVKRVEGGI